MNTPLLLLLLALLSRPLAAQTTIVGRVTDHFTGQGLPDVTVYLKGTSNGTTTAKDGTFRLTRTPADSASRALVFSAINYVTVERPVADSVRLALAQGTICYGYPDAQLTLLGGLRYVPFGGRLQVYGSRFVRLPLRATIGCQTDFRHNSQQLVQLEWLDWYVRPVSLTLGLRRQALRNAAPSLRFTGYSLTAEADFYHHLPVLLLSAGRGRLAAERGTRTGFGYEGGFRQSFRRPRLTVQATATRWPGYWQWQGRFSRWLGPVEVSAQLIGLRRYREISLGIGYAR